MSHQKLVIFGASNILSDLWDAAMAHGLTIAKTVLDAPAPDGERDISLQDRLAKLARYGQHRVSLTLDDFLPEPGELYLLGPTTPTRVSLARRLTQKFDLHFHTLIHPSAYVSTMADLSEGVFIGANSVIGPGAMLAPNMSSSIKA